MKTRSILLTLAVALIVPRAALAAENLRLAPGLSFTDDSSSGFPIEGDRLADARIVKGLPTVVFFGASNCWNTNREAERLIALYPRFRDRVSFVIVDVDHPSDAQQALMKAYYRGSIPTLAILDAGGNALYAEAGETARRARRLEQARKSHRACSR